MPLGIMTWIDGLKAVDRRGTTVSTHDVWPYWFPEPAMVIGSNSIARRKRAVRNWLLIRPAWMAVHRHGDGRFVHNRSAKEWGMFLGYTPEIHAMVERARAGPAGATKKTMACARAMEKFKDIIDVSTLLRDDALTWYGRPLADMPEVVPAQQITWELHELSFRAELVALDRCLVQPDADDHWMRERRNQRIFTIFRTKQLFGTLYIPSTPVGFAAPDAHARAESLEALRWLMQAWPMVPDAVKAGSLGGTISAEVIENLERVIVAFYCSTFYRVAGRAPVLPRVPPPRSA